MIELFFLLCATITAGIAFFSFRKNNTSQPVNRYRKTKKAIRTQLMYSAQSYSTMRPQQPDTITAELQTSDHDSDSVLGLRSNDREIVASETEKVAKFDANASCVIVMYLMAPDNCVYGGYELLQALLSSGLRYGKQRIFNRHTHKDGRGDILFHCASAMEPGTFDLTKMGSFTSKGLCFFFSAQPSSESMSTFDCLLETLDQLVEDLGGQVLDDRRELLTKEKMISYRQKIRAAMNNRSTADMIG